MQSLLKLPGLAPDADEAAMAIALDKRLQERAKPDPKEDMPMAAVQAMLPERGTERLAREAGRAKEKVNAALRQGSISPAMRDCDAELGAGPVPLGRRGLRHLPCLTRDEIRAPRRRAHFSGTLSRIDSAPELRAFLIARLATHTFTQIRDDIAESFPPDRRTSLTARPAGGNARKST